MYRVYAEFTSRAAAEQAANRLRSSISQIGINIRPAKQVCDIDNRDSFAAESAVFSPNSFFQNSASALTAAIGQTHSFSHEFFLSSDEQEHILCVMGTRQQVEMASHMLRSLGGMSISFFGDAK